MWKSFCLHKTLYPWTIFIFSLLIVATTSYGQAQSREETLQQENAAYEKAISNCENKMQEKVQEADTLRSKLKVRVKVPEFVLHAGFMTSIVFIKLHLRLIYAYRISYDTCSC